MDMNKYVKIASIQAHNKQNHRSNSADEIVNRIRRAAGTKGYHVLHSKDWIKTTNGVAVTLHSPAFASSSDVLPPHKHDFYELSYVYSGEYVNELANERYLQQPNTLTLMGPEAIHSSSTRSKNDIVFNIIIERSVAEKIFISILSKNNPFYKFFLDSVYGINDLKPFLIFNCSDKLTHLVHEIIAEYFDKNEFFEDIILVKLTELFIEVARHHEFSSDINDNENHLSTQLLSYIQDHYSTVTLDELASAFNYSTSYISRMIKTHTHKNFSELILEIRLDNACNYLRKSELSVHNIMSLVGYGDINHFNKIFRAKYNTSPSKYRERCSEELGRG